MADVFSQNREKQREEQAVLVDLWSEVEPEKTPIDWVYVSVSEGSVILGRLYQKANPTLDDLKNLLPPDGAIHPLHLDFRGAGQGSKGHAYPSIRAASPAATAAATTLDPNAQVVSMLAKLTDTVVELARDTAHGAREQRQEMGANRKIEMDALNKLYDKLADKVGAIEASRQVDPTTAMVKAALPYASKAFNFGKGMLMEYVVDAGGMKEAATKAAESLLGKASMKAEFQGKIMDVLEGILAAFAEGRK